MVHIDLTKKKLFPLKKILFVKIRIKHLQLSDQLTQYAVVKENL